MSTKCLFQTDQLPPLENIKPSQNRKNTAFYDCQNQILKFYSVDEYTGTYITIFIDFY